MSESPPVGGPATNTLTVGVTNGQHNDYIAATSAEMPIHNQHLMGWGAGNPEPSPGQYDWASLDERVADIQQSGAEPVMTLCCAPDWMKGGQPGSTDWSNIAVAPTSDHISDFAALAAAAAQRYPQIKRFQVWNELKGFYDPANNSWNAVAYTNLYNAVYDAVKAARPDASVGGPYVPLDIWSDPATMSNPSAVSGSWGTVDQRALDVLDYWFAHAHGADFVSVDGWTRTRDAGFITDPFTASDFLLTMNAWLRQRTSLPIWWAEFHVSDPALTPAQQNAVTTVAIAKLASSGARMGLLWQPQAEGADCTSCLWSDPNAGPVQATPLGTTMSAFSRCFPAGSPRRSASSSDPGKVFVMASDQTALLVNQTGAAVNITFAGTPLTLDAYGVKLISDNPACQL